MTDEFFKQPVLNSPYDYPSLHWELDDDGQPTQQINKERRKAKFITPIPKPKKRRDAKTEELFDESEGLGDGSQKYDPISIINELRSEVDAWRKLPNEREWQVTPQTARLLKHWRHHDYHGIRPFFCQVEAAEVAIWLTEVAPKMGKRGSQFIDHLKNANADANPGLSRLALKLATGAGKTTVMAMLIAWQTVNAVRQPNSKNFTKGFLVVTPGITIKDRLRVLQPNDPDSYYKHRELVPGDMLRDLQQASIIITNYHAFKRRERMEISAGGRALLKGRRGGDLNTLETEGQMLQRVMPGLMGMKNIMVLNDEAHHCYREKPGEGEEGELTKEDKEEAKSNREAARLWITGLEIVTNKLGINRIVDLSATPFFLRGSGYAEGTLFPWTMNDFSLMDAIECGIVKLPRVPVSENIPGEEMPVYRNLWEHIRDGMPKKGRAKNKDKGKSNGAGTDTDKRKSAAPLDPHSLPMKLQTALQMLYGHYAETSDLWRKAKIEVPPCFIIVCNNISTSKLVYDYIAGFHRVIDEKTTKYEAGKLELFRNYDDQGKPLPRLNTLLINSQQLESGDALDDNFRKMSADEIERFRREIVERTGNLAAAEKLTDQDLLREVMNTVGKPGTLGSNIRCVVSVAMLTEGWDANTVTHVLGVRAFGTQLLCEQVVGRALRRQNYELNEENRFNVEYADVLGIPFDFTAKPVIAPPQRPSQTINVTAVSPERDHLEIEFPRVIGYRVDFPNEKFAASFTDDSKFVLTPEQVGPTKTENAGIIGEGIELNLVHTGKVRLPTIAFHLAYHLLGMPEFRVTGEPMKLHLFGQFKQIAMEWLEGYFEYQGGTYPAQLLYREIADIACKRIAAAINKAELDRGEAPILAVLDPYNPTGSTRHVNFNTSKKSRWKTDPRKSHINWVITDGDWEAEFCRVAEAHDQVIAYAKNHSLGLEVPYHLGPVKKHYRPDFIVQIDDGQGADDPLNLIVEIKGYRGEDAKNKKLTMDSYWVPGVNHLGSHGRWAFAEFTDVFTMGQEFAAEVEEAFGKLVNEAVSNG